MMEIESYCRIFLIIILLSLGWNSSHTFTSLSEESTTSSEHVSLQYADSLMGKTKCKVAYKIVEVQVKNQIAVIDTKSKNKTITQQEIRKLNDLNKLKSVMDEYFAADIELGKALDEWLDNDKEPDNTVEFEHKVLKLANELISMALKLDLIVPKEFRITNKVAGE